MTGERRPDDEARVQELEPDTFEAFAIDARTTLQVPIIADSNHRLFPLFCPRPTVRILFYTDESSVTFNSASDFGVNLLRDLILSRNTFYVNFQIDLLNRHQPTHAANKLTAARLANYDQVWFFGVRQCNQPGLPENELTNQEVADLEAWMQTGGVLMTGDHANLNPNPGNGLDQWVNLGRALGHRVPRAGELRKWEGLPNATVVGSHNTQVSDGSTTSLDNLTLQDDQFPQELILKLYPLWSFPRWFLRSMPHPLFCGRRGPIRVFPDHMHEGQLVIPAAFPAATWPSGPGGQPQPEIVASGTDKRNGSVYGIVTAYDGAAAGVGRIVADATWHHYFNVNLRGFPPGAVLDDIADFYVNLAVWLSPAAKRSAMRCHIWWVVALHPAVMMVKSHSLHILGRTAYDVLGRAASRCAIVEFLWPIPLHPILRERFPWPPEELILGGIIEQYHAAMETARTGGRPPAPQVLASRGLRQGLEAHIQELTEMAQGAREFAEVIEEQLRRTEEQSAAE